MKNYLPKDQESSSSDEEIPSKKTAVFNNFNFLNGLIYHFKIKKNKKQQSTSNNKKDMKPPVEEIKATEENQSFDTQCKFEFPVFVPPQIQPPQPSKHFNNNNDKNANKNQNKVKKIDSMNAWEKQNQNPFIYFSTENKVSKKALNEEFPSLGGENKGELFIL